jgi:hypothetical protein
MIAGIPTLFQGRRYRSRLEARWAAFFTRCGWAFEYEPFDLHGWIPDFVLVGRKPILCEVKPIVAFDYSYCCKMYDGIRDTEWQEGELLLLGARLIPMDTSHTAIGWLCEMFGDGASWCPAPIGIWSGKPRRLGFCHEEGSYTDRISGVYDGGSWGVEVGAAEIAWGYWQAAGNDVQWKAG